MEDFPVDVCNWLRGSAAQGVGRATCTPLELMAAKEDVELICRQWGLQKDPGTMLGSAHLQKASDCCQGGDRVLREKMGGLAANNN